MILILLFTLTYTILFFPKSVSISYVNASDFEFVLGHIGTGFQSKGSYLFGHFSMHIKMVAGDSAGTVTAFYVSQITYTNSQLIVFRS